jgi:hypothetical protein
VLYLLDSSYQQIRRKRFTRKGFFQDILALTGMVQKWPFLGNTGMTS